MTDQPTKRIACPVPCDRCESKASIIAKAADAPSHLIIECDACEHRQKVHRRRAVPGSKSSLVRMMRLERRFAAAEDAGASDATLDWLAELGWATEQQVGLRETLVEGNDTTVTSE